VKTQKLAGAAVGAATAATVFLLGSTAASADPQVTASASLLTVSGAISVSPSPYAQSVDGEADHQELASIGLIPSLNDSGIAASLLSVDAEGHWAQASVTRLNILELVKADLVKTWCDGDEGGLDLVGASILGQPLTASQPGATVDVSPLIKVELNKQTRRDGTLTVEGLKVTVVPSAKNRAEKLTDKEKAAAPELVGLLGGDASKLPLLRTVGDLLDALHAGSDSLLTVTIGTATCTFDDEGSQDEPAADEHHDESEDTDTDESAEQFTIPAAHREAAPPPTIVPLHLPVTG
jgi:hypothetical protein